MKTNAESDPIVSRLTTFILRRRKAKPHFEDDGVEEAEVYEGGTKKRILEEKSNPAQQNRERIAGLSFPLSSLISLLID